jgi:hypothetical protein
MPPAAVLNAVSFYSAFIGAVLHLRASRSARALRTWPRTTVGLAVAVIVPTIGQFAVPALLGVLQRDAAAIASGEWWRLATALFVQDGGVSGAVTNIAGLLLVGSVAEPVWGGRTLVVIFLAGGLCTEVVALWWQPIGAGNSIANVSVAASLAAWCLIRRRTRAAVIPASTAMVAWAILLGLRDIHAAAAVFGGLLGAGLCWRRADQSA